MSHDHALLRPSARQSTSAPAPVHERPGAPAALSNRLLASLQAKLEVGSAHDAYEQEADAMADAVLGTGAPDPGRVPLATRVTPLIQRAPAPEDAKKKPATPTKKPEPPKKQEPPKKKDEAPAATVQRKAAPPEQDDTRKKLQKSAAPGPVPETTERDIDAAAGGGLCMDAGTAAFFGERFGTDFSKVRIHHDAQAAALARSVHALAFTRGSDIYFDAGRYQPGTTGGRRLLAHELTHTIQQGAVPRASAGAGPGTGGPRAETTVAGQPPLPRPAAPRIQRTEEPAPPPAESLDAEPAPALSDADFALLRTAIETLSPAFDPAVGRFERPDVILFNDVAVPSYKKDPALLNSLNAAPFDRQYGSVGRFGRASSYERGAAGSSQRQLWKHGINRQAIINDLTTKSRQASGGAAPASTLYQATVPLREGQRIGTRVGRRAAGPGLVYLGTLEHLAEIFTTPSWSNGGIPVSYRQMQVEHLVEMQIGNWRNEARGSASPNVLDNMVLLSRGINSGAGRFIQRDITTKLRNFINQPGIGSSLASPGTTGPVATSAGPAAPAGATAVAPASVLGPGVMASAMKSIKSHYNLEFSDARAANAPGMPAALNGTDHWSAHEIDSAEHMDAVEVSTLDELGSAEQLFVFTSPGGGFYRPFGIDDNIDRPGEKAFFGRSFLLQSKSFNADALNAPDVSGSAVIGELRVRPSVPSLSEGPAAPGQDQPPPAFPFPLHRMPGARYAACIDPAALTSWRRGKLKGASPVTIDEVGIDADGIYLTGHVVSDVPLLRGSRIDFGFSGGELSASKTFSAAEIQLPAPFSISALALTLSASTRDGLAAEGRMDFGIERVGTGYLEATARTGRGSRAGGFTLGGGFDFDTRLFDPASITLAYADGELSGTGSLGIPPGRIRGIASARLQLAYAAGNFTAEGSVVPDIPGIREGTMSLSQTQADGLVIAGTLALAPNPAIRGGSLAARVQRNPDGSYKVAASGTAEPAIPHVDAALAVSYDDGAFDASVDAAFSRGLLNGRLRVAATNRPVNPATGEPGGEPGNAVTVYGGGQMTMRFTPWLQGTAGIRLLPNGEIELIGEVALPSALTVFERREVAKNIFRLNLDIPIVGVSILGQNVGIFATIGGGLDVAAGIGPGQLTGLSLGVTYNPDHEEQTRVHGAGEFVVPADASLRLGIRGGIGAGIPIVSARAGLEVAGSLALAGEARAAATVDWTPASGVELAAEASIVVEPKLVFDVSAFVEVTADLLIDTVELYSQHWNLAHAEYGSGLRFGVAFPIRYSDATPFDLSLDDVAFTVPEVDPLAVLSGLLGVGS